MNYCINYNGRCMNYMLKSTTNVVTNKRKEFIVNNLYKLLLLKLFFL